MRMITCNNGHYYDSQAYSACPYCSGGVVENITKKTEVAGENIMETKKTEVAGGTTGKTSIYQLKEDTKPTHGDQTVYMSTGGNKDIEEEATGPVLLSGWLVIVSGNGKGTSFPLTFGMNTIGREKGNHVYINNGDNSISREKHAIVIYDYQNNMFFVKHGDGQYLSYLNGNVLLENKELKANDKIKIGNTELIFVPLCSEHFTWEE